jgi:hypothetical protein
LILSPGEDTMKRTAFFAVALAVLVPSTAHGQGSGSNTVTENPPTLAGDQVTIGGSYTLMMPGWSLTGSNVTSFALSTNGGCAFSNPNVQNCSGGWGSTFTLPTGDYTFWATMEAAPMCGPPETVNSNLQLAGVAGQAPKAPGTVIIDKTKTGGGLAVLPSAKFPGLLCRSPLKIPGKIGVGNDADPPPKNERREESI